ncbi:MAG TPA: 2Fe-2S iron-sulfur cluster binding domain-containing protein [Firmicutes bacterium]|nr:2Fe-2S iron-sulfur cluster binding domain-containing protein [Bacillota bacterium]
MIITIDGKQCEAQYGEYILDVARRNNIFIPTLCHSDALPGQGNCRLCIVEVLEGKRRRVVVSCSYPVKGEVEVLTNTEKIRKMRKNLIRLLAAAAPDSDFMRDLQREYGLEEEERFQVYRGEDCILCGLCVRACEEVGIYAISTVNRGITKKVSTPYAEPSAVCIGCGACARVCPTGSIKMKEENGRREIWGKTFALLPCPGCGKPFITREELAYVQAKTGLEPAEILCEKCRQKRAARKMRDVFKDVTMK